MTVKQKEQIKALRWRGATYKAIGQALDLPLETVKSFCRRNSIVVLNQTKADQPRYSFCENCGVPIEQVPKQKSRKFCCSKCREIWWNKNGRLVNTASKRVAHCAHCGKEFYKHKNSAQRFCCHRHYIFSRFGEVREDE